MRNKKLFGLILTLLFYFVSLADPPAEGGKAIFLSRCAACHNVHKQLTGPALSGVTDRRSTEWIINFVRSSQSVIKGGDKDAVALFESFNKIPMPDHKDLTDADISSIIEYINLESKSAAVVKKPVKKQGTLRPFTVNDYPFLLLFLFVVASLIATFYFAAVVRSYRNKMANG